MSSLVAQPIAAEPSAHADGGGPRCGRRRQRGRIGSGRQRLRCRRRRWAWPDKQGRWRLQDGVAGTHAFSPRIWARTKTTTGSRPTQDFPAQGGWKTRHSLGEDTQMKGKQQWSQPLQTDAAVLASEASNFERISGELRGRHGTGRGDRGFTRRHTWQGQSGTAAQAALVRFHEARSSADQGAQRHLAPTSTPAACSTPRPTRTRAPRCQQSMHI